MTFTSVDLPAPLSPSRPSTSPRFTRRFTFCKAVSAPKRFATFSTRRASVISTSSGLPQPGQVLVCDHRDQDRRSLDQEERVRVDADQVETVLEHGEDEHADESTDHRAGS